MTWEVIWNMFQKCIHQSRKICLKFLSATPTDDIHWFKWICYWSRRDHCSWISKNEDKPNSVCYQETHDTVIQKWIGEVDKEHRLVRDTACISQQMKYQKRILLVPYQWKSSPRKTKLKAVRCLLVQYTKFKSFSPSGGRSKVFVDAESRTEGISDVYRY